MGTNYQGSVNKRKHSLVSMGPLLPFWLLIWIIIKLGQLPIKLVYIIALVLFLSFREFLYPVFRRIYFGLNLNRKIAIPRLPSFKKAKPLDNVAISDLYQLPTVTATNYEVVKPVNHSLNLGWRLSLGFSNKKKRGRPRTQPLFKFYGGKIKRFLNRIFPVPLRIGVGLTIVGIVIFGYSYFLVTVAHDLPSPERLNNLHQPLTTKFYDRNNKLLYQAYEGRNSTLVKLDDLPQDLVRATVAIEDKHFFDHPGIDFFAIMRAFIADMEGKDVQGASTLTQQLIKNTLLTPDRTFERKLKEVLLAYWTEKVFTKQQILQMYFNEAPYGGASWGIEAASETYFNKPAKDLDLAESALLAGLPASPTEYSPFGEHPEYAKQRQKKVLDRMIEDHYITHEQADKAYGKEITYNSPNNYIKAPHFVMYTRSVLAQKYGEKVVSQGGLNVITTLDLDTQQMAESIVADEVAKQGRLNVSNGAAMITDAKTGQILAMVGSKDYYDTKDGNFNVTLARRQPGSSIKPITYTTGFKQGYSPGTIMLDTPVAFKNAWETYAPVNYDGKFHGAVTVRTALGSSFNIPAVKMLDLVGIPNMIQTAKDLGISTFDDPNRYGLSLTLGGGEVRLIDMMTAYGTFSQGGMRHDSTGILKVTDSNGIVLEDNQNLVGLNVLDPGIAYMITSILTDNDARTPAFGPNSLLKIPGHTVAVKTGTTDNKRDNWTFGYTPEFVVGVWVGNNNNIPMDPQLTSGITGAAPIWNRIMTSLIEDKSDVVFVKPGNVATAVVDGHPDLVLNGQAPKSVVGYSKKKIKDDKTKADKEVITFTDPFSTFTSDSTATIKQPLP